MFKNAEYVIFASNEFDATVRHALRDADIPHRKCYGGYTMEDGTHVRESSWIIPVKIRGSRDHLAETIRPLVKGQESVLVLSPQDIKTGTRRAALVYLGSGEVVHLGWMHEVSKSEAHASPGYTYINGRYFTTRESHIRDYV